MFCVSEKRMLIHQTFKEEREEFRRKFRTCFFDQMNKRINQYITDYEELDPDYENDED